VAPDSVIVHGDKWQCSQQCPTGFNPGSPYQLETCPASWLPGQESLLQASSEGQQVDGTQLEGALSGNGTKKGKADQQDLNVLKSASVEMAQVEWPEHFDLGSTSTPSTSTPTINDFDWDSTPTPSTSTPSTSRSSDWGAGCL